MKDDTIIALAVAGGIIILGYKLSESVGGAIENTGSGLRDTLSGAGAALEYSGMGVYELGSGTGYGIGQLGEGVGSGIEYVGAGVYEIGRGAGYAISGANPQDIIQTITNALRASTAGGEASTYNQTSLRAPIDATGSWTNQTSPQSAGVMPTAESTLGLKPFNPINNIASFVGTTAKKVVSVPQYLAGGAVNIISGGIGKITGAVKGTSSKTTSLRTSSASSGTSGITGLSSQAIKTAESLNIPLVSTALGVQYASSSSLRTTKTTSTKKWYNPLSWF